VFLRLGASDNGARVFVKDIAVTGGWEMQIVRCEPGARFPVHTHESPEFLFILEGELVQAGRHLGPGGRVTPTRELSTPMSIQTRGVFLCYSIRRDERRVRLRVLLLPPTALAPNPPEVSNP
jgi:hypothetical protein